MTPETRFINEIWLQRQRWEPLTHPGRRREALAAILALPAFAAMGLDPARFVKAAENAAPTWSGLFHAWWETFAETCGRPRVGEKTPHHILHLRDIDRLFPGCRFILMVRDPRAVVNSRRRLPFSSGSIAGDAEVWRHAHRKVRTSGPANPANVLPVRYESLVSEPASVMREVLGHLGLPPSANAVPLSGRALAMLASESEPWKQKVSGPLDPTRAQAWREELTTTEIHTIEAVAFGEMGRLGYQPLHDAARLRLAGLAIRARFLGPRLHNRLLTRFGFPRIPIR